MLLKRGGKDMKKQIKLKLTESNVIAYMNEVELFRISNDDKSIDIDSLYKLMAISKDDTIENSIEEIKSQNRSTLEVLYDNTKLFLEELIKKLNEVLKNFNFSKEAEILIKQ